MNKVFSVHRGQDIVPVGHSASETGFSSIYDFFASIWVTKYKEEWASMWPKIVIDWSDQEMIFEYIYSEFLSSKYEGLLGASICPFRDVLAAMLEFGSPPRDERALKEWLAMMKPNCDASYEDGFLEIIAGGEYNQHAWYVFDRECYKRREGEFAYLLQEGWKMPTNVDCSLKECNRERRLYCVYLSGSDRLTLSDITGFYKIAGVDLPSFKIDNLEGQEISEAPIEFQVFSATMVTEQLTATELLNLTDEEVEKLGLGSASLLYSMDSNDRESFGSFNKSKVGDVIRGYRDLYKASHGDKKVMIQTSPHFSQLRFLNSEYRGVEVHLYFDDVWMYANPQLANSLLRYAEGVYIDSNKYN